jgi:hypothetical protein
VKDLREEHQLDPLRGTPDFDELETRLSARAQ